MKAGASCFILMLPELILRLPRVGPGAWVAAQCSGSLGRGAAFGGLWVSLLQCLGDWQRAWENHCTSVPHVI